MKKSKTERGFSFVEFDDIYGQICSIQESSLATRDAIWIGVDNTGPSMGNKDVNGRMHVDKKLAKKLITRLQRFVNTGRVK